MLANSHDDCAEMHVSETFITFPVAISQPFALTNTLILATTLTEK